MHRFPVRVYYEDTDLAGIVYYANYLRFIERGRSEWLRDMGFDQAALKAQTGVVFAVRRLEADYLSPARFDDALVVVSRCRALSPARLTLTQEVCRGEEVLFRAEVVLVALTAEGRPARLPQALRSSFEAGL